MRIAVVGSGIAGLSAAWKLSGRHAVVLFEADTRLGGHTHTVDIELEGRSQAVDTGFLVYNERTYPLLIALFQQLGVVSAPSDMSFSVSRGPHQLEWCGSSLSTLFAQRSNLVSPRFWGMLRDILRFNRQATRLAQAMLHPDRGYDASEKARGAPAGMAFGDSTLDTALEVFLRREGYGEAFAADYLLPMAAAIWSCPMDQMRAFPMGTFVRFFHNHGLLQIANRPRWFTVRGGARHYVDKLAQSVHDIRLGTPVTAVEPISHPQARVQVTTSRGREQFDAVVLACHSDQSLRVLKRPRPEQREVLQAIRYQPNRAWLHTDDRLMPRARKAWAAWNYLSDTLRGTGAGSGEGETSDRLAVSVSYWLNRLQPLDIQTPVFVSLNPLREPDPGRVLRIIDYAHPVFDLEAVRAQRRLPLIQGMDGIWLAGAWTGYGFHEDGLRSGLSVAQAVDQASPPMALAA